VSYTGDSSGPSEGEATAGIKERRRRGKATLGISETELTG